MMWNELRDGIGCNPALPFCPGGFLKGEDVQQMLGLSIHSLITPVWGLLAIYAVLFFIFWTLVWRVGARFPFRRYAFLR